MDYNLNIISEEPAALNSKDKDMIWRVSKMKLAFKYSQKEMIKGFGWLILCLSLILFLFAELNGGGWIFILVIFLIGLITLLIANKLKDKLWILDRTTQNITIPLPLNNKPIIRSVYNTRSNYKSRNTNSAVSPQLWYNSRISNFNKYKSSSLPTWWSKPEHMSFSRDRARTWSFFIWYLDKNRPLPPGDILDPFREEDFLRRKAEGFPPPLFCSCVPTPEITPEQQAERERYWKDEDYIFRLERYKKPEIWDRSDDDEAMPLQLEKGATIIHRHNTPDNWTRKPYPEFENFRYLPTAYAMRYQYNDGRIFYALIDKKTEEVYTPPTEEKYKKEIIRYKRNTIE